MIPLPIAKNLFAIGNGIKRGFQINKNFPCMLRNLKIISMVVTISRSSGSLSLGTKFLKNSYQFIEMQNSHKSKTGDKIGNGMFSSFIHVQLD